MASNDIRPLMQWDSNEVSNYEVLWWARFGNHYQVEVRRITHRDYCNLLVFDHSDNDKCVLMMLMVLEFDADNQTPDVSDIAKWEEVVENLFEDGILVDD